jgi:hypothetical protein
MNIIEILDIMNIILQFYDTLLGIGAGPANKNNNILKNKYMFCRNVPFQKAYRKCCVKFRTTPISSDWLSICNSALTLRAFKMSKTKNLKRSYFGQSVFLERRMRSAAKRVEQSWDYWYLSKMEWFSLQVRP